VAFIRGDAGDAPRHVPGALTRADLAELPEEVLKAMKEALVKVDVDGVLGLLEPLEELHPEIVPRLGAMLEEYAFEGLAELLD
jgi:hypothetical protein